MQDQQCPVRDLLCMIGLLGIAGERCDIFLSESLYQQHDAFLPSISAAVVARPMPNPDLGGWHRCCCSKSTIGVLLRYTRAVYGEMSDMQYDKRMRSD